jgi:hypothetical protein
MQEDKEPLFDAIDTIESCLDATAGMLSGIEFDRERLEAASGDEMLAATEVADLLVRRGVPFREAHGIVGGLVRDAVDGGRTLSELTPEQLRERSEHLDGSFYEVLQRSSWLESKRIAGWHLFDRAWSADRGGRRDPRRSQGADPRRARVTAASLKDFPAPGPDNPSTERLTTDFFARSVHLVARELIGCRLFFKGCGGVVVETESYERDDPACHAYVGLTRRTEVLFGPPGGPMSTSPTASTACSMPSPNPRERQRLC